MKLVMPGNDGEELCIRSSFSEITVMRPDTASVAKISSNKFWTIICFYLIHTITKLLKSSPLVETESKQVIYILRCDLKEKILMFLDYKYRI